MTRKEEQQLIRETHENNLMLRNIIEFINSHISTKDAKDFGMNIIANIIGNKIT